MHEGLASLRAPLVEADEGSHRAAARVGAAPASALALLSRQIPGRLCILCLGHPGSVVRLEEVICQE